VITTNLSAPTGIVVNTCGDALVSSDNTIQRFALTKNTATGALSAQFLNTYVTFPRGDVVTFAERDAANVLWVNTNSTTAGGKVWRILPAVSTGGDPISSCTSGTLPPAPLVTLKALSQGRNAILDNSQLEAVGLAIPFSDFAAAPKTFSPGSPSQTWNFGHYSVRVDYTQVFTTFAQSLTAVMSRPQDVTFGGGAFASGTAGNRYPSLGGTVIQFRAASPPAGCGSYQQCGVPVAGTDFATSTVAAPAFRILLFYDDPIQGFQDPGVARAADGATTAVYTEDSTRDVWTGEDGVKAGSGNGWSKYVGFDAPFKANLALPLTVTLTQPALSGNPLFNIGQNFAVKVVITDAAGRRVQGLSLRLSALRFSPKPFVFETVQATSGTGRQNTLNDNGNGQYSIGVSTGLFQGGSGTYQFTLFGDGFPPFVFYAQFEK
jgi:hypothetical protein